MKTLFRYDQILQSFCRSKWMVTSLILVVSFSLRAQNISTQTISWNSTSVTNQADNKTVDYNCSFKTTGNSSVDWIQGLHVSTFTVTSQDGQWSDLSADGQVTFNIQNGGITGSIQFSRSASQYSVHLKLYVNGAPDQDYVFSNTSISAAQ